MTKNAKDCVSPVPTPSPDPQPEDQGDAQGDDLDHGGSTVASTPVPAEPRAAERNAELGVNPARLRPAKPTPRHEEAAEKDFISLGGDSSDSDSPPPSPSSDSEDTDSSSSSHHAGRKRHHKHAKSSKRKHKHAKHHHGSKRHHHKSKSARSHWYSKKGQDPPKKLGAKKGDFAAWLFYIRMKFSEDASLFPSDRYKIRYALTQTETPLWDNLRAWLENNRASKVHVTWPMFLAEIEKFLDIPHLVVQSRSEAETARQNHAEDVSELFARMSVLWLQAGMTLPDKLRNFCQALCPQLQKAVALIGDSSLKDERDLLDAVRTA
ncbi:hypothetical protein KEM56_001797 [Ascosphaera pollenicola]|nr:hypothetical protein KEM56_001797 [Ascosphaera pollenicola]